MNVNVNWYIVFFFPEFSKCSKVMDLDSTLDGIDGYSNSSGSYPWRCLVVWFEVKMTRQWLQVGDVECVESVGILIRPKTGVKPLDQLRRVRNSEMWRVRPLLIRVGPPEVKNGVYSPVTWRVGTFWDEGGTTHGVIPQFCHVWTVLGFSI